MSLRSLETSYAPPAPTVGVGGQTLAHQFEDLDQQNECYIVGMWTFLVTEIMFFGALFLAYTTYRILYFPVYLDAHRFLSIPLGGFNTFVLLTSSLAMALGVHAAQNSNHAALRRWLAVVVACSFIFLGVKYVEYSSKFREKLYPGPGFNFSFAKEEWAKEHPGASAHEGTGAGEEVAKAFGPRVAFNSVPAAGFNGYSATTTGTGLAFATEAPEAQKVRQNNNKAQIFFSLYFGMTGLHAIHIIIGILMMTVLAYLSYKKHSSVQDYMTTEMIGFYWHFVDIVWIFLFPLMYLIS